MACPDLPSKPSSHPPSPFIDAPTPRFPTALLSTVPLPHNHTGLAAQRLPKSSKIPSFQVFCDAVQHPDTPPIPLPEDPPTSLSVAPQANRIFQTVVNEKENRDPVFDQLLPSVKRYHNPRTNQNRRILGNKVTLAVGTNCAERWDGKIPFAPCSPDSLKRRHAQGLSTQPGTARPLIPTARGPSQPCFVKRQESISEKKDLANSFFHATLFVDDGGLAQARPTSPPVMVVEVTNLVAKFEALETKDEFDAGNPMSLPLPVAAVCPGAPKIPSSSTLPSFDSGESDGEAPDVFVDLKSPNTLQMSPLAEVTEAYTGMQGGWSPSLQTTYPPLDEASPPVESAPYEGLLEDMVPAVSTVKKVRNGDSAQSDFRLDHLAPRFKRRREYRPAPQVNNRPLMRI